MQDIGYSCEYLRSLCEYPAYLYEALRSVSDIGRSKDMCFSLRIESVF